MPTQDCVRSNERSDFRQSASSDSLAPHGKSPALIVGQPKFLATELLLEDSVLLTEVLDDRILLTTDPTGHRRNEDLPGLKDEGHSSIVARRRSDR